MIIHSLKTQKIPSKTFLILQDGAYLKKGKNDDNRNGIFYCNFKWIKWHVL